MPNASQLHEESLFVDGLFPQPIREDTVARARDGGLDAAQTTLVAREEDYFDAIEKVQETQATIGELESVSQARSVREIREQNDLSIIFGFQNSAPLERHRDPHANTATFAHLGVKVIQLTYNKQNYSGSGCTESNDSGLTDFGAEVIDALEAHNVILDLSHAGDRTVEDALSVSSQPVIFSHSNARSLVDYVRNIPDHLMEAAVNTGGLVGISGFAPMLDEKEFGEYSTIEDFLDQIEYVANLVGPENVSIGLDTFGFSEREPDWAYESPYFPDPPNPDVENLWRVDQAPNVTDGLVDRGFNEDEIKGILGENLLEVFDKVWEE